MPDINLAYTWAINTCNAGNVGYSMTYRNQQTVNGITYYDCSSFINYALLAGEWSTPDYAPSHNPFTTFTEPSVLINLGFTEYTVNSTFEWKAGDIGWKSGHTEMCYQSGTGSAIFMGAHTDNVKLVNQVSIGLSSGAVSARSDFTKCYRYGEGGAETKESYSTYVIAAMCGNFWRESHANPAIWEGLEEQTSFNVLNHGYGIGQWTNTGGDTQGRLYKLYQWLTDNGYTITSLEGELKYIIEEDVWHHSSDYQLTIPYTTLSEFLSSASTDLDELTKAYMYCWEGINDGTLSERQEYAQKAYDYIIAHANDTSITTYYYGNRYLSYDEYLNNCVMIYRLMGGIGGGGGTVTKEKKTMPVWMMIRYF